MLVFLFLFCFIFDILVKIQILYQMKYWDLFAVTLECLQMIILAYGTSKTLPHATMPSGKNSQHCRQAMCVVSAVPTRLSWELCFSESLSLYCPVLRRRKSEVAQSCPILCDPMDCSLPGSSVHGIFQARVLEWVAISFSRGSSWPRDWTWVSCIAGRRFTIWATGPCLLNWSSAFYSPKGFAWSGMVIDVWKEACKFQFVVTILHSTSVSSDSGFCLPTRALSLLLVPRIEEVGIQKK